MGVNCASIFFRVQTSLFGLWSYKEDAGSGASDNLFSNAPNEQVKNACPPVGGQDNHVYRLFLCLLYYLSKGASHDHFLFNLNLFRVLDTKKSSPLQLVKLLVFGKISSWAVRGWLERNWGRLQIGN